MESVANIIARYGQSEPEELKAIKHYVMEHYHVAVRAAVSSNAIVVIVASAALANTLRLQTTKIQEVCKTQKKLVFRIS